MGPSGAAAAAAPFAPSAAAAANSPYPLLAHAGVPVSLSAAGGSAAAAADPSVAFSSAAAAAAMGLQFSNAAGAGQSAGTSSLHPHISPFIINTVPKYTHMIYVSVRQPFACMGYCKVHFTLLYDDDLCLLCAQSVMGGEIM